VTLGTVERLVRYPVKSLAGEELDELELDRRGPVGDRLWGLVDDEGKIASGKPTRRFRKVEGLLHHAAWLDGGLPVIEPAGGDPVRADGPAMEAVVAQLAGPGWRLAREDATPHHDAAPLHLVTTATLARLGEELGWEFEWQRLRPNVVVQVDDPPNFVEDGWVGQELAIGEVVLRVTDRCERCVMVNHSRPGGLEHRREVLKQIGRSNDVCAGVYAEIVTVGRLRVGDTVIGG